MDFILCVCYTEFGNPLTNFMEVAQYEKTCSVRLKPGFCPASDFHVDLLSVG